MAVTLRFQSTGAIPGSGDPVRMVGPTFSIGRGEENDLVLPDGDRMLSKQHCLIDNRNGSVVVVDVSTNGTFLNYGKIALGNTPTPLNDGDVLSLGPYELMVEISADRALDPTHNIADPLLDGRVSFGNASVGLDDLDVLDNAGGDGDFLDDLLSGRDIPAGPGAVMRDQLGDDGLLPPLGEDDDIMPPGPDPMDNQGASMAEHSPSIQDSFSVRSVDASVIPEDWEDDFLGNAQGVPEDPFAISAPPSNFSAGAPVFIPEDDPLDDLAPQTTAPPVFAPPAAATPVVDYVAPPAPPAPPVTPAPPVQQQDAAMASVASLGRSSGANDEASRAFLRAVGASDLSIDDADLTPTMSRLGHVLRIMIHGMREILMTRTSIKSEFRIEQTMIRSGGNNPLKFSISPEQAVEAMVKPTGKGYLDAAEAAEQALRDIKAHEIAMVTGMEAALKGVLQRLDPAALESKIKVGGVFSTLLKSKKAQYWEIYETMFAEISDQAENDFHELFSREFARAYREQLEKLK